MSSSAEIPPVVRDRTLGSGRRWATASLAAGITGALLTALAATLTFTTWLEATAFNGPLALIAFAGAPAALLGVVCAAFGLNSAARSRALAGLALCAATIVAWIAIVAMAPWPQP